MRVPHLFVSAGVLAATLAVAGHAQAASGELVLGLDVGYALLERAPQAQHGAAGQASLWIGMTETLWLSLSGGSGRLLSRGDAPARWVGEATGGLVLALDVFRAIPYLEFAAGVVGYTEDLDPIARLGAGVDYFLSPGWVVGAVVRFRFIPEPLGNQWVTASARIAYRFDL